MDEDTTTSTQHCTRCGRELKFQWYTLCGEPYCAHCLSDDSLTSLTEEERRKLKTLADVFQPAPSQFTLWCEVVEDALESLEQRIKALEEKVAQAQAGQVDTDG